MLQRNIGRYVFSRASIEQFKAEGDAEAIGLKAIELLRKANNPNDYGAGGELGEILLYLFLENKLDAPKLLSKVELKTSDNHLYAYEAAQIAKDANVDKLLLTHLYPEVDRSLYLQEAKQVFENTQLAEENKKLILRR